MVKIATNWSGNVSAEANRYRYNSATIPYNSSARTYNGIVSGDLSGNEKTPLAWTKTTKNTTAWSKPSKTPTSWSTP